MTVNNSDTFIVNRSTNTYSLAAENLMAEIQDTDLMMVNREGQTYKVTGAELKESFIPPIEFTPSIIGENKVEDELTALAGAIRGGFEPIEYAFQWKRNGTNISSETAKTYTLAIADIGTTISCDVTVAEPDGSDALTKTAVYDKTPISNVEIITPTIIAPPDGAGVGGDTTYTPKTSAITDVVTQSGEWTGVTSRIASWSALAYGNGKYVAVAADGVNRVMYSSDGLSWTATQAAVETISWFGVTYGNGKFVAVGAGTSGPRAMISTDNGVNWTSSNTTPQCNWQGLAYGNGKFVAVGADGSQRVMHSTDGITWTGVSVDDSFWTSVTYGNGKFVAVASGATTPTKLAMYSTDGANWTSVDLPSTGSWYGVTYGDGKFVAVAYGSTSPNLVAYSSDGINWESATAAGAGGWKSIAYGNGYFVAVAQGGGVGEEIMYSNDCINWTALAAPESNSWYGIVYGQDKFVSVAYTGTDRVMWSYTGTGVNTAALTLTDANTYNAGTGDNMNQPISETFTAGQTVTGVKAGSDTAVGTLLGDASGNTMAVKPLTEPDFKSASESGDTQWQAITYGNGKFMAVGGSGDERFMYSTDGINWNTDVGLKTGNYRAIIYADNKWVVGSWTDDENLKYSTDDGVTWSNAIGAIDAAMDVCALAYGNGRFVAVGDTGDNRIMYSDNGITWTTIVAPKQIAWKGLTFGNGMFVAVAVPSGGDPPTPVMYSTNGINWTLASADANNWRSVTYAELPDGTKRFVAVSTNGTHRVMWSDDAINWNPVLAPSDNTWYSVTYGDGKFLAVAAGGGIASPNRVMYSSDGTSWTLASATQDNGWQSVTYGNGKFVSVAADGTLYRTIYSPSFGGAFVDGMKVINDTTVTEYAPSAESLEFVGSTPTSDPVDGVNVWGNATWEVSTDSGFTAPMVGTKIITPGSNQTLLPAERGAIVLDDETDYYARLSYNASDPSQPNVTSSAVHFKTAEGPPPIDEAFNVTVYSGQDTSKTVTTGINYLEDTLVWIKCIQSSDSSFVGTNHYLVDLPRDNYQQWISSNTSEGNRADSRFTPANGSFDLEGGGSTVNGSGNDYVSYSFKAAPKFFDIVTYDGAGSSTTDYFQVPHNLRSVPGCMIIKRLSGSEDWGVYHKGIQTDTVNANANVGKLNTTTAFSSSNLAQNWGFTDPTDREFTTNGDQMTGLVGEKYVAYLFADTPGLIKCGVSADVGGARDEVNLGFKPAFVLTKNVDANASWIMVDIKRGIPFNPIDAPHLYANSGDKESSTYPTVNMNSTEDGIIMPTGPGRFIYIAIAKGGSTRFFDTEAFKAITDSEVTARYGVDPYTTNLEPFGIQRLMNEPTGVTAGYSLCEDSDTLCPIQDLSNTVNGLQKEVETAETRANALKQIITRTAVAVAGYFPLFRTEEAANTVGDGTSHSHELNGVTYYMPNGVTIYHGDYTS